MKKNKKGNKYQQALQEILGELYKVGYSSDRNELNEVLRKVFDIVIRVN